MDWVLLFIDFEILHIIILLFKNSTLLPSSEKPKWKKIMVNHYQTISQPMKLGRGLKNQHQLDKLFKQLHHLSNIDILVYKYLKLRNSVSTCVKMKKWTFFGVCCTGRSLISVYRTLFHAALWLMLHQDCSLICFIIASSSLTHTYKNIQVTFHSKILPKMSFKLCTFLSFLKNTCLKKA